MMRRKKHALRTAETAVAEPEPRAAAIGDVDGAEEAAELVGFKSLRTMISQAADVLGVAGTLVDELIAAETSEQPAETMRDEDAETTVETAKLGAILAFCGQANGTIYGIQELARRMLATSGGYALAQGESMPMAAYEGADEQLANRYITRLGRSLERIALPADHPLSARLLAARGRINAATKALEQATPATPAAEADPVTRAACGKAAEGDTMKTTKEACIAALITAAHTPWTPCDKTYLESLSDERLTTLEAQAEASVPVTLPTTEEEFLAAAPESIKKAVEAQRAAEAKQKADLVTGLKTAQSEYSEAELQAMEVAQLERLTRVAAAAKKAEPESKETVDFSGQGGARAAASADDEKAVPPPPDITARILAARKAS